MQPPGSLESSIRNPARGALGSVMGETRLPPHVDVKRLGDVDLEASGPGTVGRVHESDTQQLVVVVTGPVENHAGAWQGGDVALWVGCALSHMRLSELT